MNKYKIRIFLCYIGIIITLLMIVFTTYTYFYSNNNYSEEDYNKIFKENTSITFNDTSNLSIIGNTINNYTKEFSIENKTNNTIYYDIKLDNVVNNYENKDNITIRLVSSSGAYVFNEIYPKDSSTIVSNVKLDKLDKHEYVLFIYIDSEEEDKTLSSNIVFIPSKTYINYENNTLGKIIKDKAESFYESETEDGLFYINSSIEGKPIYFYRGTNELKNNVVLDDMCFKIIRTTYDGGIRVIYDGIYENNICSSKKVLEETTSFNNKYNSNAFVGYMYGTASSDNYTDEHKNTNSSIIKLYLEKWYKENMTKYNSLISKTSIYCNYRIPNEFTKKGVTYKKTGYSNNNTGYYNEKFPSYNCRNENDRLSVSNGLLSYPVGLITVDELIFAGFDITQDNLDNFLYSSDTYYTMTSAYYNANGAYNYVVDKGKIIESRVDEELGVRPVITFNSNVKVLSGDGSIDSPFIIKKEE